MLLLPLAALACGVDRRLRIDTLPQGAEVTLDGKFIGVAPIEVHFTHYGERKIYIAREGFEPVEKILKIEPPWYGSFPFDIISEVLVPVWRTDFRNEQFTLQSRDAQLTATGIAQRNAELEKAEAGAVARARALRAFAPGDPIPTGFNSSHTSKDSSDAASRPSDTASRPQGGGSGGAR